jgi:hypothetical protein
MPRLARLNAPGVLHHIMIRGIERRNIFRVEKDREDFLDRLLCAEGGSDRNKEQFSVNRFENLET